MRVELKKESAAFIKDWLPGSGAEEYVTSAYVTATKPLPPALALAGALARWGVPGVGWVVELAARLLLSRGLGLALPSFLRARGLRALGGAPAQPAKAPAPAEKPKAAKQG